MTYLKIRKMLQKETVTVRVDEYGVLNANASYQYLKVR